MESKPPINRERLESLRALQRPGRPSLVERVVKLYEQESVRLLEDLRRAIEDKQAESVRTTAHRFKSISGDVGAETLAAHCLELEMQGRDGNLDTAPTQLEVLEREHLRVSSALLAELG